MHEEPNNDKKWLLAVFGGQVLHEVTTITDSIRFMIVI